MTDKDAKKQGKSKKNNPAMAARKLLQTEVDKQTSKFQELLKLKSSAGIERVDLTEMATSVRTVRGGAKLAKVTNAMGLLDAMLQWCEFYCENWCQDVSEARREQQAAIKKQLPTLSKACDCLCAIAREAVSKEKISVELIREASDLSSQLATTPATAQKAPEAADSKAVTLPDDDSSQQVEAEQETTEKGAEQAESAPSPSTEEPVAEQPPEPAPSKEVTPAILKMRSFFWKELEERVEVLTRHLLELEQGLNSPQRLETMMRMAHTIKGGARLADIDPVMQLAHTLEDIFVSAQKQQITINSNHTDLLLKGVDSIVQLSEQATQQSGIDQAAMTQYQSLNKELGKVLTDPGSFKAKEVSSERQPAPDVVEEVSESSDVGSADGEEAVAERVIRVNAEKLNKVIGLAGELSVESRQLKKFWQENIKLRRNARTMNQVVEKCVALLKSYQIDESDRHYLTELMRESLAIEEAVDHNCEVLEDYERKTTGLTDKLVRETLGHRMRPFKEGTQGLLRLARTVSQKLGKRARLEIRGENTQVDRDILERLNVPLTHLIQNALDHGLETTDARLACGKPEEGHIVVEASHKAGLLVVTVKDDGGGVNREKLRASILKKNMATEDMVANMSDTELYEFLLLPNFSLKDKVTTVSGRGVGMDLIHEMVQELRGRIVIHSEEGKGCCFELLLPLTLSMLRCVVVEVSGFYYALPVGPLNKVLTFTSDAVNILENRQYLRDSSGVQLGLVNAHQLLELAEKQHPEGRQEAIVLGRGSHQYAMTVDSVIGETTLVERPIDPRMGKIKDISSAAFLDDGTPILILDADDLVISIERLVAGGRVDKCDSGTTDDERAASAKRVLVVDDSMTVRELERSLLEDNGYRVDIAVDGADGWNAVRMNEYDLVISDIDMPRMDGFEFISHIRSEHHMQHLPVIIISYKDRESDRKRGMEVGADHYLTKGSFMDETFISTVKDLIGNAQSDETRSSGDGMNP
ncbi:hybrid sensor histidine kinase/response regulator [Kistimonas asteriae]|uniref:hybrid sensor histidine kinase/response regulator n=1 Tax=Kistimonas asteriae TaxID=517724 RepID=UPI001BABF7C8|nr:response regulator [Kistimonas asteriae]